MAKDNIFFTSTTEIGKQHTPIDSESKMATGGNVLLAPNGKPSHLTAEQYKLVRTPAFKKWFGDWENDPANASKVVDENGEPLMVIHKTNSENDFYFFDKNKIGDTNSFTTLNGFFFGNYKKQSDNLRNILCFLSIKNPIVLNQSNTYFDSVGYQEAVQHFIQNGTTDYLVDYLEYEEYDDDEINEILDNWEYADGVIVKNLNYDNFDTEFVAFEPNQIKLADGTNTTFDGNNPDIRFEKGGLIAPNGNPTNLTPEQYKLVRTPEFKKWFGDWEKEPENASKVVDSNGEPLVCYHGSNAEFNIFDKDKIASNNPTDKAKLGFWFTDDLWEAEGFAYGFDENMRNENGRIITSFLNIREPLNVESKNVQKQLNKKYSKDRDISGMYIEGNQIQIKEILNSKNDGIVLRPIFIVFESNQIKLADGTNTTFDGNNPDIRFKDGGSIYNERIVCQKCDWSWKVVDGGDDLYVCHKCGYDNAPYYATKFAGGGGIDINEPFDVNGKTLAERVRVLLKQLYPTYKWSVTSSYSKMDVYLLEADFEPFTDFFKQKNPDRNRYSVDDRDFEEYMKNNANITERAVEVFKPIREYINKFVYNRNANDPYADSNYNIYEYTYIGKWDKPYVQVAPKAGKKAKATATTTPSPTTLTPRADYPFEMGDILAPSQEQLDGLSFVLAAELSQYYYEVAEMITSTQQYFIEYNDRNESQTVTVEGIDILKNYVKATTPLFKADDTVVNKGFPNNPLKITRRIFYQNGLKYSENKDRFELDGFAWQYQLADGTYFFENEIQIVAPTTQTPPTTPTVSETAFLDYLKATNEKAELIPQKVEVLTSLALFIKTAEEIDNIDTKKYAELLTELMEVSPKNPN